MSERSKILLVDDDPDTLRLLSKRLMACGYEIFLASDGVAAMTEVRRQSPDLIVLDLGLPAGDGFMTLERLRDNPIFGTISVVVLTGQDASEARTRAMDMGAKAFFEKTVGTEEFLGTISPIGSRRLGEMGPPMS
jgi:DNA-binding response OmpR family regulator